MLYTELGEINLPVEVIPVMGGQRHHCLFHLARLLKTQFPMAVHDDMLPVVRAWHAKYKNVIFTQNWDVTWADFKIGWQRVRIKFGQAVLDEVLATRTNPSPELLRPGYSETMADLISVCEALQRHHGSKPFFLGCRQAGEILQLGHTHAATLLNSLVQDGVLEVTAQATSTKSRR